MQKNDTDEIHEVPIDDNLRKEIDRITSDREVFNNFIYTPIEEAFNELEKRRKDTKLQKIVDSALPDGIPEIFKKEKCVVLHRQVITPNYEVRRFISAVDALELNPIFFEYTDDKFVTESDWKYSLGNLSFYIGVGKKGGMKSEKLSVIDFNTANGRRISEIKTKWNQSLVDFHHEMLDIRFPKMTEAIFDGSIWYSKNGGKAKNYYAPLLLLFTSSAILFENFMLDEKELSFTKEIFLPAFINALNLTGKKPIIVALEPTEIEGDNFWNHHPFESFDFVKRKLNGK